MEIKERVQRIQDHTNRVAQEMDALEALADKHNLEIDWNNAEVHVKEPKMPEDRIERVPGLPLFPILILIMFVAYCVIKHYYPNFTI